MAASTEDAVMADAQQGDVVMQGSGSEEDTEDDDSPSLIIPITSGSNKDQFIEIFPEEMADTPSSTLLQVLKDEDAPLTVWSDAALMYIQQSQSREASALLQAACDRPGGSREERVRIMASAGIAHLTQAHATASSSAAKRAPGAADPHEDLRAMADNKFTNATKVDTLFPMTWVGRAMLNLDMGRMEQANFFFDTTLNECGDVLPALLGKAGVMFAQKQYEAAQEMYAKAIRLYPKTSGAATRVGFGLACYRLGQVDRAKAAFARALAMDPENVNAMVGAAILDMASLDETSRDFNSLMEKAIKMMSMANLLDNSNAMVQNHLANHYFWKWTPLPGTVEVTQGSNLVRGSQPIPLEPGERIRIGTEFETYVADDDEEDNADDEGTTFRMRNTWKSDNITSLKVWKKDYHRVLALAKGAYNSTSVTDIQAESLYFLARVYHVRDELENAHKFYERACQLAPNLTPARFGLAQTLIAQEQYDEAEMNLTLVLGISTTATDALAALGLLLVKGGKKVQDGLSMLRKAIDLDPLNPDLILLEALALQQQETNYVKSLDRYKKAVQLMERQGKKVSFEVFTNIAVLCHETKKNEESLEYYLRALDACDKDDKTKEASIDNVGKEGGLIRHPDNNMFTGFVKTELQVTKPIESSASVSIVDSAGKDLSELIKGGDYIRLGLTFETKVIEVSSDANGVSLKLEKEFSEENNKENTSDDMDVEGGTVSIFVKRENHRLDNPKVISIAFNLARLHETAGRSIAAVELHKAIVKRNPAYVNSYLRLACIAIDCGALKECAAWLKIAAETSPGNPEVLTLIGNLHLSLCDWQPAQQVFDGLLVKKVPNVEAYAMLSLGNIYFANLKASPKRYLKHLQYSADYYKRILSKNHTNAYAANGLGTVLAEKAELDKAKEIFTGVRQVSDDGIADAMLNLGHIYLAQKKHPEALQMYQSYLKRTVDGSAPISSKSRVDDEVDVLLYIAFAYFDWARQTELLNNAKAAPADGRYKKAMENLEIALSKGTSKAVVLTYNLCMTKLQAANCVLQKLTRNIRRTAKEVEEALEGLQESLTTVEEILQNKTEGKMKVHISTSVLNDFISHCKSNIDSAKSHLEDERKREEEAHEIRELQRLAAESQRKEEALREEVRKSEEIKLQEERDAKAQAKMRQVEELRAAWEQEQAAKKAAAESRKAKKNKTGEAPAAEDSGMFPDEDVAPVATDNLFEDSDDSDDEQEQQKHAESDQRPEGDSSAKPAAADTTQKDLFGDSESDSDSDEELKPSSAGAKRNADLEDSDDGQPAKRQKVLNDDDSDSD